MTDTPSTPGQLGNRARAPPICQYKEVPCSPVDLGTMVNRNLDLRQSKGLTPAVHPGRLMASFQGFSPALGPMEHGALNILVEASH